MRTYKMYYTAAASGAGLVPLMVQKSGRVKSVRWAVSLDVQTDNSRFQAEVSMVPATQIGTNDSIGTLDQVDAYCNSGAAGVSTVMLNEQRMLDFQVNAGERFYLNTVVVTCTYYVTVFIDVAD